MELKPEQESKIQVMEMKFSKGILGKTRRDKIRKTAGVARAMTFGGAVPVIRKSV